MNTPAETANTPEDKDAKLRESSANGIGGWLIYLGFTLVVSTIWQFYNLGTGFLELTGLLSRLSGGMATYIYALVLVDVMTVAAWLYVVYLFFNRHRNFPKWFVGVVLFLLVSQIVVIAISASVFNVKPASSDYRDVGRTVFYCLIWFTYVAISRRVRYTFIH